MKDYHKTSKKFRSAGEETHGKGRHFVHKVGERISFKTPKGRTSGKVVKVSKEFYMVSNKDKLYKVNRNSILYSMGYVDAVNRTPTQSPPSLVLKKINIFPSSTTISGTTRLVTPIKVGIVTDIDIPIAGPTTKPSTSTPVTEQGSNTSSSTTRTTKPQTTTKTSTTTKKTPVIMKDTGRGRRGEKVFQRTLDRLQLRNPELIIPKSIRDKPIGPILNDTKFIPKGTKLINKTKT